MCSNYAGGLFYSVEVFIVAEPADRDTAGRQHSRHLGENANHHSFLPFPFLDLVLHQELFKAKHVICLAVGHIDGVSGCTSPFWDPKITVFPYSVKPASPPTMERKTCLLLPGYSRCEM
jgi:hypothetical protein